MMARLELFSLIKKYELDIAADVTPSAQESKRSFELRELSEAEADALIASGGELYVKAEFTDRNIIKFYISTEEILYYTDNITLIDKLLSSSSIVTDDSKPLFAYCDIKGVECRVGFDISLAAYLLSPSSSSYELDRLCAEYSIPTPEAPHGEESAAFIHAIPALSKRLMDDINELGQDHLLYDIEIPLAKVLARMENIGFEVDVDGIRRYGEKLSSEAEELRLSIYDDVGYEFNINSPKQLAKALFEDLNLPHGKKTKSGYSTNAEVLESLIGFHPVIGKILEYRTVSKLKSTYCDSLIDKVAPDGRIHSSFNQTETRTGRISSTEPNLQNIPVRTERGREFRRFFRAKEGCVLVDADYSQIELRVLAHISGDENMKQAFLNGTDIHAATASQVFGVPLSQVTPLMRSRAKAVNFGIVYGIGAFSLSKDIGVSMREAKRYIEAYLSNFSSVNSYMQDVIARAKRDGYVETLEGRRRYLPELSASNFNTRSFGERVARNAPIQGTAADIIKIAMIRVDERLKKEGLDARLILQVHDELIVEAPAYECMQTAILLQEEMENAVHLSVPLTAEAAVGETWYDAKG